MGESDTFGKATQADALVSEWKSLQQDIREYKKQSHRRILSGMVVMAAVAGYALRTTDLWLFGFIPLILWVIFVLHVQESNHVYYRNWQCVRIEKILRGRGVDGFDWALEFSPLSRTEKTVPQQKFLRQLGVSTMQSPAGGIYVLGLIVYVVFSVFSIIILPPIFAENAGYVSEAAWVGIVLVFYSILTVTLFGIGYTSRQLRAEFEQHERDDEAVAA